MKTQISGLVVYAKDCKKLAEFYSTLLQLNVIESDAEFVLMELDGLELVIVQSPPTIAEKITITNPPNRRENTAIKPVFFIKNIQSIRELAQSHGGFVDHPQKEWEFRDSTVCDGYDPEGNVFQLRASHTS